MQNINHIGGCIAINCHNSDKKSFWMFNYPTNEERRKRWLLNIRRNKFVPTKCSQLCEIRNYFLSIFVFHFNILCYDYCVLSFNEFN